MRQPGVEKGKRSARRRDEEVFVGGQVGGKTSIRIRRGVEAMLDIFSMMVDELGMATR